MMLKNVDLLDVLNYDETHTNACTDASQEVPFEDIKDFTANVTQITLIF